MIHADFGGYRLLSVARLLEISFQRAQHLVRVNYTFFWQLVPPLPAGRPESARMDQFVEIWFGSTFPVNSYFPAIQCQWALRPIAFKSGQFSRRPIWNRPNGLDAVGEIESGQISRISRSTAHRFAVRPESSSGGCIQCNCRSRQ